jgi:vitamin B12/bleomycin/antimicrobial peptide transport system ATP-binding/permease protein
MADKRDDRDAARAAIVETSTLYVQIATVAQGLNNSPVRKLMLWSALGMLVVIVATAGGQLLLNRWNKPFYDAIERRDLEGFQHQLMVFAAIAGGLLLLNIIQQWLDQRFRLRLREALTLDLASEWLKPGRAFRLANAGAIGVNPDQRMQQDAGHLSDLSTDLGVGFVQSFILLVSFVGVLWGLSSGFVFHFGERTIDIPGYMVWAAILYAGSASGLSWLVGRPLIELNSDRYSKEAELRHSMVRINEHIDAITLARGEADEQRRIETDLGSLLAAVRRIYAAQINLAWVTDSYGWMTVVAPILIASPVYFAGDISFGGLMVAVSAFNQVNASLRWFINNIGAIADWRATLMRVADFRLALNEADNLHGGEKRIEFGRNGGETMTFDALEICTQERCTKLWDEDVTIASGEHVFVTGEPNAGKTLFFRALAGLWPWGDGRIGLPAGEAPVFVPRTPYFAPGTLHEILDSSGDPTASAADVRAILDQVGLGRLAEEPDRTMVWERQLNESELRLLAMARLAARRPRWIVIDGVLDTFDGSTLKMVMALFEKHLGGAAIINISQKPQGGPFFDRTLTIAQMSDGRRLPPARVRAGALEPPPKAGKRQMA